MSANLKNFLKVSFLSSLFGLVLILSQFRFFDDLENSSWDLRLKYLTHFSQADPKIKIVMIDQSSLDYYANQENITWPWPRAMYAPMLKFLKDSGAKGVAFDLIFSENSSYGVDDDLEFAVANEFDPDSEQNLKTVNALVLSKAKRQKHQDFSNLQEIQAKNLSSNILSQFLQKQPEYQSITLPFKELLNKSSGLGNVSSDPDPDGIFRHTRIGASIENVPVLNLPFALYQTVSPQNFENTLADLSNYVDEQGRLTVRFNGPALTYETLRIESVIQSYLALNSTPAAKPQINPATFKDAWVFVGAGAPGLLDSRPTPLAEKYPGVEYNATILDNLLHQKFIKKANLYENIGFLVTFTFLFSAIAYFTTGIWLHSFLTIAACAIFIGVGLLTALYGFWFLMAKTFIASIFGLLVSLGLQYQSEGKERRFIKGAFGHYVGPEVIDQIIKNPKLLMLGGEKRELSFFFSDIKGFTSISEKLSADKLVSLLNQYLSAMTEIILESGGTLDKYVGDAIVAFWNAPLSLEDHAQRAVKAALKSQQKLYELKELFLKEYDVEISSRIGINTGIATVGNFGSKERFDYTVIGDQVNLASRLEGANKVFGTKILVTEATKNASEQIKLEDQGKAPLQYRKIGLIKVVGKDQVISVYEPLSPGAKIFSLIEIYNRSLNAYENADLLAAKVGFQQVFDKVADSVAKAYLEKISQIEILSDPKTKLIWDLESK